MFPGDGATLRGPLPVLLHTGSNVTSNVTALQVILEKDGQEAQMALSTDIISTNIVAVMGETDAFIGVSVLGRWTVTLIDEGPGNEILSELNFTTVATDCGAIAD